MTPEQRDERDARIALALTSGMTIKQAAKACKCSAGTVERISKMLRAEGDDGPPVELNPNAPAVPTYEAIQRVFNGALANYNAAMEAGNENSAKQWSRQMATFAPVLSRLEQARAAAGDEITITPDEYKAADAKVRAILRNMAARPLLCAHCSRELSVRWGAEDADETRR